MRPSKRPFSGAGRNNSIVETLLSKEHGERVKIALVKKQKSVPTADEYRRLAAECFELAPKISPDLRAHFIALSQGWAKLADQLEENHRTIPDPLLQTAEIEGSHFNTDDED
jgi:hypothetical protein